MSSVSFLEFLRCSVPCFFRVLSYRWRMAARCAATPRLQSLSATVLVRRYPDSSFKAYESPGFAHHLLTIRFRILGSDATSAVSG